MTSRQITKKLSSVILTDSFTVIDCFSICIVSVEKNTYLIERAIVEYCINKILSCKDTEISYNVYRRFTIFDINSSDFYELIGIRRLCATSDIGAFDRWVDLRKKK